MAFFLIVPSVMIVSVLLTRALAGRLGLRIYYPTLAAVAITTLPVMFLTTRLSPALGREYFLWLGALIAASSGVLTLANKFLLNKELDEERRFTEEVKAAYEAEKRKSIAVIEDKLLDTPAPKTLAYNETSADEKISAESDDSPADKNFSDESDDSPAEENFSAESDDSTADKNFSAESDDSPADKNFSAESDDSPADKNFSAESDDSPADKNFSAESDEQLAEEPSEEVKAEIAAELSEKPALPENFPLEKIFKPLPEPKQEDIDEPLKLPETSKPSDEFPLEKVFKPLSEVQPEEIAPPVEKKPEPEKQFPLQKVFEPLSTLNLNKLEEITREEKNLPHEEDSKPEERIDTLDDLLDKAYEERDKGHVWQAIATYKKALERYQSDEYAPFVAIDLCNIYKEQALYTEAIKIYEKALTLPAVKRNDSAKKEFQSTLRYLRLVREVLLKHRALSTPFSQLPKEILQEVDTEFKKVQYQ